MGCLTQWYQFLMDLLNRYFANFTLMYTYSKTMLPGAFFFSFFLKKLEKMIRGNFVRVDYLLR